MIKQTLDELIEQVGSRYALVTIISKRSRQIMAHIEQYEDEELNPVNEAVEELVDHRLQWRYGSDNG